MKKCFECETTEDLHEHHVVPKSKGGTNTITLCHQCHMKAHGRDGKGLNHSRLIKEGQKKAKERGVKLGQHNPKVREAHLKRGKDTFMKLFPHVQQAQSDLQMQGLKATTRAIANLLNEREVPTPSGKDKWQSAQITRILQKAKQEKK